MADGRKTGAAIMIVGGLLFISSILLSDGWNDQFGIIFNLLSVIRVQYFVDEDNSTCTTYHADCNYGVDIATKYLILLSLMVAALGLSFYLGIVPIPKRKRAIQVVNKPD